MIPPPDLQHPDGDVLAAFLDQLRGELAEGPAPALDARLAAVLRSGLGRPAGEVVPAAPRRTTTVVARPGLAGTWRRARAALAVALAGGVVLGTGAAGALPGPVQSVFERAATAVGLGEDHDRPQIPAPTPGAAAGASGAPAGRSSGADASAQATAEPVPGAPSPGPSEAPGPAGGGDHRPGADGAGGAPAATDEPLPSPRQAAPVTRPPGPPAAPGPEPPLDLPDPLGAAPPGAGGDSGGVPVGVPRTPPATDGVHHPEAGAPTTRSGGTRP